MSLVSIGTVAFDSIETPFGKVDKVIGGACTYISLAASYFTDDLNIVSVVGDDFPQSELDFLASKGIDLQGLEIKKGEKTFFWAGKYYDNMNQRDTLVTELNVLEHFDPKLPEAYQDCKYLMLGNLTPEIQYSVIKQLKNRPKLIVMDTMNFWMDIAIDALKKVIAEVDVLTINDEEARQLSGEHALITAAKKILQMGPKYLIIKKGEHGALLFDKDNMFYAPAMPLAKVFDPTGAGDTFAGGFIGYLAKTDDISFENMKRAIIYGSTLASFCVEEFSIARLKNLTQNEINERSQQFCDLVRFDLPK